MAQISDKEYKKFSEQLAQRFERKVKEFYIPTTLQNLPQCVRMVPLLSAVDVMNIDSKTIKSNEIYFYTNTYKQSVFNLLRHFRNCSSHKDRITKVKRNGQWYYQFEDKGTNGNPYISMKGNICCDIWDSYIEDVFTTVLKERQVKKNKKQ
jgi:hypothetical protein